MSSSHTIVFDSSYYLHRAFNVVATRRSVDHIKKNTLTMFLQLIASDILELRGTHALLCFDAPHCFRYDVYKDYKSKRNEGKKRGVSTVTRHDGTQVEIPTTPGAMVKSARKLSELAGLTHAYKERYEADDLMGSAAVSLPGRVTICTRDKDAAVSVNERVHLFWPKEKKVIDIDAVKKIWGITPSQMRDYLCLLGDDSDSIPGVPDFGPVTAKKLLTQHGSIAEALKDPVWNKRLRPHRSTLSIARQLVTLKTDVKFNLDDLAIKEIDDELAQHVWEIPKSVKDLGDIRKASSMKGLFG